MQAQRCVPFRVRVVCQGNEVKIRGQSFKTDGASFMCTKGKAASSDAEHCLKLSASHSRLVLLYGAKPYERAETDFCCQIIRNLETILLNF